MSDLIIFLLGCVVTAVTLTALILIGVSEAKALEAGDASSTPPPRQDAD
jgi:hypothetical protein